MSHASGLVGCHRQDREYAGSLDLEDHARDLATSALEPPGTLTAMESPFPREIDTHLPPALARFILWRLRIGVVVAFWTWLQDNPRKAARLETRIFEGLREVGLLLIAFAPLEAALSNSASSRPAGFLIKFLGGGLLLFGLALLLEWRFNSVE